MVQTVGWAEIQKVARINWSHSSLAGDSPPEHFEPNWRSVGACAILRQASKVLASMYWRSKIRGRNFGLKLKSYYANRPLGTRKWLQNLNRTPNKTFLLVKFLTDRSIPENRLDSLIQMLYLVSKSNSNAIFVFPGVDLYNRILISSQNSDLEFSTSSTMRPKLWRPGARWRKHLQTSNWAQNVQEDCPQLG